MIENGIMYISVDDKYMYHDETFIIRCSKLNTSLRCKKSLYHLCIARAYLDLPQTCEVSYNYNIIHSLVAYTLLLLALIIHYCES